MVIKKGQSIFLSFYKIATSTLINFSPIRSKILKSLSVKNIEELDPVNSKLIIKNEEFLEVWSLESELKEYSLALSNGVDGKYSRGMLILLLQDQKDLKVFIHDPSTSSMYSLVFKEGTLPDYCEIVGKKLVIGMTNKPMLAINYTNNENKYNLAKCIRYYEMENYNDAFLLLENDTGIFLSNPDKIINCGKLTKTYVNHEGNLIVHSRKDNCVKIIYSSGDVDEVSLYGIKDLSTLGTNLNSLQIYVGGTSGMISVFE